VYVASSWVLVEILDRLVERYLLSPYLTDIVFWGLFSLIPAVVLVAWTHGRPGKDKSTRVEKVGVPINLIATVGLLITAFGDKDLDLAATQVTINNELGQQETYYIPSETFRRRMAVFFWQNESGDPELDWLQYGVTELLVQDLKQDPFVFATSPWYNFRNGFYSRMQQAGFEQGLNVPRSLMRKIAEEANRQYFVEGSLDKIADEYVITARVWDTQTLAQVAELSQRSWDIYAAIDQLSIDIRSTLEVPESSSRIAEDLPLAETYGESESALKAYIHGLNARLLDNDFDASNTYFDEAIRIDPNFVRAWFLKAVNLVESGDYTGAQVPLKKAQELDYRLPSGDRAQLKRIGYWLAGEQEKLMSFLRLQVKIRDDANSHAQLATMSMIRGELETAKTEFQTALERDALNVGIYLQLSSLERASGNMDAAVAYAQTYQQKKPEDIDASIQLGDLLRDSGELDAAEEQFKQAQILQNAPVRPTLKLAMLAARKGDINAAKEYLSQAEGFARTAQEKVLVRQGAVYQAYRLGKIHTVIEQTLSMEEFLRQSQPPIVVTLNIYSPLVGYYIALQDIKSARESYNIAINKVQPPMDQFLAALEVMILAEEKDIQGAEAAIERFVAVIEKYQLKMMDFQVPMLRAKINEARGDYAASARDYQESLDLIASSVLGGQLYIAVPQLYAETSTAQALSGQLDAAERSLDAGFRLDPSEPMLWLAKARLQRAQNMPQLARASVNYALAIWTDADEDYVEAIAAHTLAAELGDNTH